MSSLIDISKNFHHAYLLEGEKEYVFQELLDFLNKELDFSTTANPDFWLRDFDSLGIDDSREIKDFQSKKAFAGDRKILVIKTNFITHEAQNSLLKVFEEPTANTHLFLIIPSAENLLPTLKSRLMIVKNLERVSPSQKLGDTLSKFSVREFLGASIAERFELIKVFLPKKKDSLNLWSGKEKADKAGAIIFLNELEKKLYENFQKKTTACLPDRQASPSPFESNAENTFSEVRKCRSYLNDRSPSVKMILEHLSQIIPLQN